MKEPAAHQAMAIDHLIKWYKAKKEGMQAESLSYLLVVAKHLREFDFSA